MALSLPCLKRVCKTFTYLALCLQGLALAIQAEYNLRVQVTGRVNGMPTYVYRCEQCNNRLEVIQKFSDAPLTTCPKCRGQLHRVIHASGIVFKGSGWYITDSRKGTSSPSGTKASAPKSTDAAPAESQPAPKVESAPTAPSSAD